MSASVDAMANAQHMTAPIAGTAAGRSVQLSAQMASDISAVEKLWQRLEADPAVSCHQSRAWVEAWSGGTGAELTIVTLEQEGKPIAILPLEISRIGGLRIAHFVGSAFSNANTGLIDTCATSGADAVPADELAAALSRAGLAADIVLFDKMPPEAALQPPFSALKRVFHPNPSFQLPLFPDFNAVLAQINGKRRRKKLRVSERRLEAVGGYRYIVGGDDAQALRLLDNFLNQKPIRLAARGLPNVFADPGIRDFLARLATSRDSQGRAALELHGIELLGEHNGQIIAVAGLTIKDQHVTCQFGSIDETVAADASAGELLFYRMIERASAAGETVFDFGVGDQLYKRSWCPQRTELVDCYASLNLKGRLAAPVIAGMIRLKRMIKTSPTLHKAAATLRRVLNRRSLVPERD